MRENLEENIQDAIEDEDNFATVREIVMTVSNFLQKNTSNRNEFSCPPFG